LNTTTDEIEKVRAALGDRYCATFDGVAAHTPRDDVLTATRAARGVGADLIVTVGGGSVTDAAKAVSLCLANDIDSVEGMDGLRPVTSSDGVLAPPPTCRAPAVRQIAVPTTLSGGEFSAIAGVTDARTNTKELFRHPAAIPSAVVLDPAVTVHTPEWLWLSTGVRAVDHAVEGLCATQANAFGDAQALEGLKRLAQSLPRVDIDPSDLDARVDCQIGTWMSMAPLVSGVPMGASHGIGYVLGAKFGIPHGHTSCIMLPAVMRWNESANGARQRMVATAMGWPGHAAGEVLDRFISDMDMPRRLSDVNIGSEHFPMIAEAAMRTPWVPYNPRWIAGPDDVLEILELAA
jgi:maleylacetate reductase